MDELLKAVEALLGDIRALRQTATAHFGPFPEFQPTVDDTAWQNDAVQVEWPNLAYSADCVEAALAAYRKNQTGRSPK